MNQCQTASLVSLEFAAQALMYLETFTGKKLDDPQTKLWTERLAKYPEWKLLKLYEYVGPLTNKVFEYLDTIPTPAEPFIALPAPEPTSREKQMAKDFFEYMRELFSDEDPKRRDECEKKYITAVKKNYPQYSWAYGRANNINPPPDFKHVAANDV